MSPAGDYTSALDLFSIGIGPSSSHTVGPMRAARSFRSELELHGLLRTSITIECTLGGSLGATGVGHGTPAAVLAGLDGLEPETCDPEALVARWECLADDPTSPLQGGGALIGRSSIRLEPAWRHPEHPNCMRLTARDGSTVVHERVFLSVGGGFIREAGTTTSTSVETAVVFPMRCFDDVLSHAAQRGLTITQLAMANEVARGLSPSEVDAALASIWNAMDASIERGLATSGVLPGRLKVPRRAADARAVLDERAALDSEEWLTVYAMAVNEENAAGSRVVTAPTNGAAGIVPAVLKDVQRRWGPLAPESVRTYLLTATVVGHVIKRNASISGAEVGCQGEVGSACAMAAAGLTSLHGGTPEQVENAAEIALEHHLGLTCDPVGGLVQIPCIERNGIAAATARTASRLALLGNGGHSVSLDVAIETLRSTGADMSHRYKETSLAGLAVNVVEC
ncbi:L-serine ammonia-lyase [Microcella sp.]|uniref:L-serine ammonia-lyase n=1 Tax=Microcella sp. TaxID=1913979 RepID=UPI002564B31E|nr:L-serine ammonia-lyase [Microcella sp.]MBX9471934.1 L-serine ammonia-lyase [Microcella sp.]